MSGRTCAGPHSRRRFLKLSSAIALGAALRPSSLFADTASVLVERAAFTMGSIVTIKVYAENVPLAESAIREAFEIMKAVDAGMSVYAPSSGLCGLNRHGHGRAVACSADLIGLLAACADYNRSTHGAFDVTIEPLMELYGFRSDGGAGRYPSDRQIAGCLDGVGMKNVLIDRSARTVSLAHPGTRIDLGGIAVGFALDRAAALLRSRGIMCALINHSGDLIAIGAPPGDRGWEIGITDPVRPDT